MTETIIGHGELSVSYRDGTDVYGNYSKTGRFYTFTATPGPRCILAELRVKLRVTSALEPSLYNDYSWVYDNPASYVNGQCVEPVRSDNCREFLCDATQTYTPTGENYRIITVNEVIAKFALVPTDNPLYDNRSTPYQLCYNTSGHMVYGNVESS